MIAKKLKASLFLLLLAGFGILLFTNAASQDNGPPQPVTPNPTYQYRPGEVLVKFKTKTKKVKRLVRKRVKVKGKIKIIKKWTWKKIVIKPTEKSKQQISKKVNASLLKKIGIKGKSETELWKISKLSTANAVKILKSQKAVAFAEPNYTTQPFFAPNDYYYKDGTWDILNNILGIQWGLNNKGQLIWGYYGKADADINAPEGWDIEKGDSSPATVAVIDSGINFDHPDLDAQIWTNADEIAGNSIDDDNNGYVDDRNGYNWTGISQTSYNYEQTLGKLVDDPVGGEEPDSIAQAIAGTGQPLKDITLTLIKVGSPGPLTVSIRSGDPDGPVLSQFALQDYQINDTSYTDILKKLSPAVVLNDGSYYYLELSTSSDTYSYYKVRTMKGGAYSDGWLDFRWANTDTWDSRKYGGQDYISTDLMFRTNANGRPHDDNNHGTTVSGVIAAETNNSIGIAGVAPGAKLMPLKVLDSSGNGSTSDLISAIYYASNNGAKVINISLGQYTKSDALQQAINDVHKAGVVLVSAAGNSLGMKYPAGNGNVIGVGATNNLDQVSSFSTQNSSVDVSAPGETILTTSWGGYAFASGTSYSAAHVSGLAALVRSKFPSDTPEQVENRIIHLSEDLGAKGRDYSFGYGRINIEKSLKGDNGKPSRPTVSSSTHTTVKKFYSNNDPKFSWSSSDALSGVAGYSYSLTRKPGQNPGSKIKTTANSKTFSNIAGGRWYLHIKAVDYFGNLSAIKNFAINIDTYKPRTSAPSAASVAKGATTRLYYKVADRYSGRKVFVTIKVKKGETVVETIQAGWVPINSLRSVAFKADSSAGNYRFYVYARDKAGNTQANIASNDLKITAPTTGAPDPGTQPKPSPWPLP